MATSLGEEGLIVPVIKGADNHSLLAMARSVNDLANRARNKKYSPMKSKAARLRSHNHGISGSCSRSQSSTSRNAVFSGSVRCKNVVVIADGGTRDDAIAIRPMVLHVLCIRSPNFRWASADWFLAKVKETIENWS